MGTAEDLAKEKERNATLKATLDGLKAQQTTETTGPTAAAEKAAKKMEVINMQKTEEALKQKIEQKELAVQHLLQQMKEDKEDLKKINAEMDGVRNSGKAVWETVGFLTHPYHDPFHTGLSKRTPTGTRAPSRSPGPPHAPSALAGRVTSALCVQPLRVPTRAAARLNALPPLAQPTPLCVGARH